MVECLLLSNLRRCHIATFHRRITLNLVVRRILIALPEVLRVILLYRGDRLVHHVILISILMILIIFGASHHALLPLMLLACGVHQTLAIRLAMIMHCARGCVCVLGGKRALPAILLVWRRLSVNRQSLVSQICIRPDGHLCAALALDVEIVLMVVRLGCLVVW